MSGDTEPKNNRHNQNHYGNGKGKKRQNGGGNFYKEKDGNFNVREKSDRPVFTNTTGKANFGTPSTTSYNNNPYMANELDSIRNNNNEYSQKKFTGTISNNRDANTNNTTPLSNTSRDFNYGNREYNNNTSRGEKKQYPYTPNPTRPTFT